MTALALSGGLLQRWPSTPNSISTSTATVALLAAAFLPMAQGHEHGDDKIPEGATISLEPIVWRTHHSTPTWPDGRGSVMHMGKSRC